MLKALKKIKNLVFPDLKFKLHPYKGKLEKIGSRYGGWIIPTDIINHDSICYLVGAGEDISFDAGLAKRFRCSVFIFDPTPKAKTHFENLVEASNTGKPMSINNNPNDFYELDQDSVKHLQFFELGLWKKKDVLKFFSPKNQNHISHSISNLQETNNYFEAPVNRLSEIMTTNHHSNLDLLKIDIEGAEFEVIDTIIQDDVDINILCIEFHLQKENGLLNIQKAIRKLEDHNYRVIARENLDFTFIKADR